MIVCHATATPVPPPPSTRGSERQPLPQPPRASNPRVRCSPPSVPRRGGQAAAERQPLPQPPRASNPRVRCSPPSVPRRGGQAAAERQPLPPLPSSTQQPCLNSRSSLPSRHTAATALSGGAGLATLQSVSSATLNPFWGIETEDPLPIAHIRSDCCQKIRCLGSLDCVLDLDVSTIG